MKDSKEKTAKENLLRSKKNSTLNRRNYLKWVIVGTVLSVGGYVTYYLQPREILPINHLMEYQVLKKSMKSQANNLT